MFKGFQYRPLFEMTFLHGFFLNNGDVDFDDLTADEQKKAMKRYCFDEAIELVPVANTRLNMKNHRIIQRTTAAGFSLSIQTESDDGTPLIDPVDDLSFIYAIKTKGQYFHDYTDCPNSSTETLFFPNNQPSDLRNEDGVAVGLGETAKIIGQFNEDKRVDNTYLLSENDTHLVTSNYLSAIDKIGLIGLIHIQIKGANNASSALNSTRKTKNNHPHFKIHFDAMRTFWKYKQRSSGFEVETALEKPISKHGFIEIDPETDFTVSYSDGDPAFDYKYPNPIPGNLEVQPASGSDPEKIYSVIYI